MLIIESLKVDGFLGQIEPLEIEFNKDINIVTGYNGAGKTNLLKLLWYTISGNVRVLLEEVEFKELFLKTSSYMVEIRKVSKDTCVASFESDDHPLKELRDIFDGDRGLRADARDALDLPPSE